MSKKYTATFTCDRAVWNEFKQWAHSCNSSASQQLSKFMQSCLIQDVKPDTGFYIDSIIDDRINKFIEERLDSLVDQKIVEFEQMRVGENKGINIKKSPETSQPEPFEPEPLDQDKIVYIENQKSNKIEISNQKHGDTEDTDSRSIEISTNKKIESTKSETQTKKNHQRGTDNKIKKFKVLDKEQKLSDPSVPEKQFYSDQEVADKEKVSRVSVIRYRKKQRNPRNKSFYERWEYNKAKKAWINLNLKSTN